MGGRHNRANCASEDDCYSSFHHNELIAEYPPYHPLFRHLYIDWDWSQWGFTYDWGLPGPRYGELLVDRFDSVEWRICVGGNCFGDRFYTTCYGVLLMTDLRVIFLPLHDIRSSSWATPIVVTQAVDSILNKTTVRGGGSSDCWKAEGIAECHIEPGVILAVQHYTYQLPLTATSDCRFHTVPQLANTAAPYSDYSSGGGAGSELYNDRTVPCN